MATKAEIDKAEHACKWITNLEAPIDVAINRSAEAIKELGKADQKKHPNIKADVGNLAKYVQSFVDQGKVAKKSAKDAIKDYGHLKDNKIDYSKFKSQATINLKTPYGSTHVWTAGTG